MDQGGGKRKGSIAIYIEPWHADIMDFLDLRKNQGKEELRARDLFFANKWPKATRKLSWLVEKFNPPGWSKEDIEALNQVN